MSIWETVVVTAVTAALVGAFAGARAARRSVRQRSGAADSGRQRTPWWQRWARHLSDAARSARVPAPDSAAAAETAPHAAPPLPPTRMRRDARVALRSGSGSLPLRRTPVLGVEDPEAETDRAVLRITTATGEITHALPDDEGLTIDPKVGDIIVPELAAGLILGRSGYVWTVQTAGPGDPAVLLDGVPLTSVAMPWTSNRRLTAGALTLTLDNARPAPPSFDEPARCVNPRFTRTCAARADAYGLAVGMSDGQDAATLVTAGLAAFDPRMLDPARAAALAALNVTLAVRDAGLGDSDGISEESPQVAILGVDARGELRAAANFDVSVWAVTDKGCVRLSRPLPETTTRLEVVPVDLEAGAGLGERPVLLLIAGAADAGFAGVLRGATTRVAGPEQLVHAVAGTSSAPGMAAAAAVSRKLQSGLDDQRSSR